MWVALLFGLQPSDGFESPEIGVRVKIPPGWKRDPEAKPPIILGLNPSNGGGNYPFPPELVIVDTRSPEPLALGQYKEQLRQYIQRTYFEPKIVDERNALIGGKPAFILTVHSKTSKGSDALVFKGLAEVSPIRLIAFDATLPRGHAATDLMQDAYDALLHSAEIFPRKPADIPPDELQNFDKTAKFVAARDEPVSRTEELDIFLSGKPIGTYSVSLKSGLCDGLAGIEMHSKTTMDLGEEGKYETEASGFFSDDLAVQKVDVAQTRVNREKRWQHFTSSVSLVRGQVEADRRINGERARVRFAVPERTILFELLEGFQFRALRAPKALLGMPGLSAFQNETTPAQLQLDGVHKIKSEGDVLSVYVTLILAEDGTLLTYWHDMDRRLLRVSASSKSLVMKRKRP